MNDTSQTSSQAPDTLPRCYRVREVARALSVPRGTVYRWASSGTLPSVRVGGVVRVMESDLLAFIRENRTTAAPHG